METLLEVGGYRLENLDRINILLGRNGSGKSTLLRAIDSGSTPAFYVKKYISPERTGNLTYNPNTESNIQGDVNWLKAVRRSNQVPGFKEQSFAQYARLEMMVLRRIETEKRQDASYTFVSYIDRINALLDQVKIERDTAKRSGFSFQSKRTGLAHPVEHLSSGESELVALAIESLSFEFDVTPGKSALLLMDEPDVHLHPDLQVKLMTMIADMAEAHDFQVLVATHSTALLGAVGDRPGVRVCFQVPGSMSLSFSAVSETHRKVLPMFGAHPLSRVFNESPIFIVEGDDECRIWQQVVRSSQGKVRIHPCECGGKGNMNDFESLTETIMTAVYDKATAFSLRDGDGIPDEIGDTKLVTRFRLKCFAAESLLLTDDVLASNGTTWDDVQGRMTNWLDTHTTHLLWSTMKAFRDGGYLRMEADLKPLRNIIVYLLGTNKPWEVLVGQQIAALSSANIPDCARVGTLSWALGEKLMSRLFN